MTNHRDLMQDACFARRGAAGHRCVGLPAHCRPHGRMRLCVAPCERGRFTCSRSSRTRGSCGRSSSRSRTAARPCSRRAGPIPAHQSRHDYCGDQALLRASRPVSQRSPPIIMLGCNRSQGLQPISMLGCNRSQGLPPIITAAARPCSGRADPFHSDHSRCE